MNNNTIKVPSSIKKYFLYFSLLPLLANSFSTRFESVTRIKSLSYTTHTVRSGLKRTSSSLFDSDGYFEEENRNDPVTRESFMKEILSEEPEMIVKRKRKKGSKYRPIDNRDSLPFVIKDCSPDPYTKPSIIKEKAKQNTKRHNNKLDKVNKRNKKRIEEGIAASVYQRNGDGSMDKVLGEFHLDKSTNCGDKLEVGDKQYQVLRAKCQYKYAGGQRFIMVRKILEVKDITRIENEKQLKQQFEQSSDQNNFE